MIESFDLWEARGPLISGKFIVKKTKKTTTLLTFHIKTAHVESRA
jgi:hypothetical protein